MNKKQGLVHSLLLCGFLTLASTSVQAQITPDSTLGVEASKLTPNVLINGTIADLVNGGAQRGNNLFHSFNEFNIKEGQGVYFGNPSGVVNILTRVTGSNASNILGTLGVDGAANLFLINPNGILFGKNASLDVRGSFVGTTANGVQFGNQGNFSATNPEAPGLLTINSSALFFNQINPNAAIQNNSVAPVGKNLSGSDVIGLRVPDGKSLLLVGGNISMDGGQLNAFGGRVELGGASKPGNINLLFDANNLRLQFPENLTRASVSLTNQAKVYTEGAGKGDIAVNAELLEMSNSSLIAGIGAGLGDGSTKGGNININADTISLTSGAFISSNTYGKGDAGDITINTRNLISKDSQLGSIIYGEGSAGTFKIIATDSVELSGEVPDIQKRFPGGILATSDVDVKGKGGYIHLETKRLSISDGSKVQTATFGEGDAGSLFIRAEEIDIFKTEKPNVYLTGIFNSVGGDPRAVKPAKGNGGDLTIETGKLSLRSGGAVGVETRGEGNAGSLFIKASNLVEVTGNLPYASEISAGVTETGVGNGGSIRIETPQLNIKDGGIISSSILGKGDAGNIDITTGSLSLTNGAQINSFTSGQGNAGNITIKAVDGVSLDGFDTNNNYSALYSNVLAGAIGNGGIINIEAASLSLTNGGELRVSVNQAFDTLAGGQGNGGTININVRDVLNISGTDNSGIFANLGTGATGRGGDIKVQAGNLSIKDNGEISSTTSGKGDSGKISITIRDAISLDTGGIYSNVQSRDAVGNAGSIDVTTGSLSLTSGAQVNSFTRGQGNAGNITIQALNAVFFDGKDTNNNYSGLSSNVLAGGVGNGGIINIEAGSLSLTNGGELRASVNQAFDTLAGGQGNGGTINVYVRDALNISGTSNSGIFAGLGTGAIGRGGNINIQARNLSIKDNGEISSTTSGKGDSGNISIATRDAISLDGASYIANNVQSIDVVGNAGNIDIKTGSLSLINGAQINSFTRGQGNAGNITIQARDAISFNGSGSNSKSGLFSIVDENAIGNGGTISITSSSLSVTNGALISSFTDGQGNGGNIIIQAFDTVYLDKSAIANLVLSREAIGNAGKINITTESLSLTNGAQIISSTRGLGSAGNIKIQALDAVSFDGIGSNEFPSASFSNVGAGAVGNGGNINITAGSLSLTNGGALGVNVREASDTLSGGQGIGGTVNINLHNALTISGTGSGIFGNLGAGAIGRGGDIKVQAGNLSIKDNGAIISSTLGKGNSGNVFIAARDTISLDKSDIANNIGSRDAEGNAGNINITTSSLSLTNGAQINSLTRGQGNAGNITIQALDAVSFDGLDSNGNESGLYSVVGGNATGNGGTVSITSGSLSLNNGGRLGIYVSDASDALQGKKATGGTANIDVRDSFIISGADSGIFASLGSGAVGTAGDINIKAGNLTIQDAGEISSFLAFGAEGRGGNVNIQAGNLFIKNNGEINSSTYGTGNSGKIYIATSNITSLDTDAHIYSFVFNDAVGNSGGISITTDSLKIANNAGIFSGVLGQGKGGNITIEAKDVVEIFNEGDLGSGVQEGAIGRSGDVTIKTGRLIVRDSQIGPSTSGEGDSGDFNIIASESVELSGQIRRKDNEIGFPGGLLAQTDLKGKGRGGNLTIETRRLSVSDGSKIQAATFGDGDAGNMFIRAEEIDLFETEKPNFYNTGIFAGVQTDGRVEAGIIDPRNGRPPRGNGGNLTIEARRLSVRNGAEVFVQTTGEGDAGNIFIRASDSVNVAGISTGTLERQRTSKITTGASQSSTGSGGSLTIETPLLNVADGGIISSSSEGKGNAGILTINANTIRLNNKASLTANTQSPNIDPNREQATINLNTQALILRRNSNITTNAQGANVIGGNININADVLAAFENSDISANSTDSRGGRVKITSLGIFGTQARNFPTLESDITATGASPEFSGTTEINTPDVEPVQGIIELPEEVVDATRRVAQICPRQPGAKPLGEFTITGRGSLPPSPLEALSGATNTTKLATLEPNNTKVSNTAPNKAQNTIVEAQGWVKNDDGSLELVASAPYVTPNSTKTPVNCPVVQ